MSEPTNGELAIMIGEVKTISIETRDETKKTNGRVTALERWKNENARFIEDLRTERRQVVMKLVDLLVKIAIGLIMVKVGWSSLIR